MRIHILGICGAFMGGIAALAKAAGHEVSGSDANVYPPISTQLASLGIRLCEGYRPEHLDPAPGGAPDCIIVGNALSRGNPAVEYMLNQGLAYTSGPQWLYEHVLRGRHVLAVAGTHGKTTTASLLAWILEHAGLKPGFLIGGVAENFGVSARLGKGECFVVEADEYDTAFFDKRSKFVHYRPRTLVLNNLEFDHADIFADLAAIKRQFHHLVRIVPGAGRIVCNGGERNLRDTLAMGCWTPVEPFGLDNNEMDWSARLLTGDGSRFEIAYQGRTAAQVVWGQIGAHNVANALAAVAAAHHAGVTATQAAVALQKFKGVKRRLEIRGVRRGITVYDDFAHHPTAIAASISALRARAGKARIIAVLEPRSNTMRMGVHKNELACALAGADRVTLFAPADLGWSLEEVEEGLGQKARIYDSIDGIVVALAAELAAGDHVLIMSNGGFGGLHEKLLNVLEEKTQR